MKQAPPEIVFRHNAGLRRLVPAPPGALDVANVGRAQRRDVDVASLWHSGDTRVFVNERFAVAVAGSPRRVVPQNGLDVGSAPVDAAGIADLWLRDGADALARLTSNFALVIFDRVEQKTHLAVDPFGLASLFWHVSEGALWACTEQAPLVDRQQAPELDLLALPDVFNLRFLPGSRTLWAGLHQVRPGTLVTIEGDRVCTIVTRRFAFEPQDHTTALPRFAASTLARLEACFGQRQDEGVREAAVLLSGGIDSTIMAALAARTFPRCVAYTARIEGFANPELPRAAVVATRLGLEHRIVDVSQDDMARLFPFVMARVQEPPRHFNNLVLARLFEALAGEAPFVVAGDAADLLFGGSELATLQRLERKRQWLRPVPGRLQRRVGQVLSHSANRRLRGLGRVARFDMDELIQRFDVISRSSEADALLDPIVTAHGPSDQMVAEHFRHGPGYFETFQQWHLATFLTAIFRRNHRLSTPFGLRLWYPLLDPAIIDLATRMPSGLKVHPDTGESKPVLRELCATVAGRDVADWSKMGFPSPELELIVGPLRAEWEACSGPDARVARLFNPALFGRLDPSLDHQTAWTLLTLEHLLRRQGASG